MTERRRTPARIACGAANRRSSRRVSRRRAQPGAAPCPRRMVSRSRRSGEEQHPWERPTSTATASLAITPRLRVLLFLRGIAACGSASGMLHPFVTPQSTRTGTLRYHETNEYQLLLEALFRRVRCRVCMAIPVSRTGIKSQCAAEHLTGSFKV